MARDKIGIGRGAGFSDDRIPPGVEIVEKGELDYLAMVMSRRYGAMLPPEVSAAVLRGEIRLKAICAWRDETQMHLAFITGIGQGYLSDLENGRRAGTPETLAKLAEALDVPVAWIS